jgi:Uma2 family endonuclease
LVCQKLLKLFLARVPAGLEVRPSGPLTLHDSEPEPDISIVRGRPDDWATEHPTSADLVFEVAVSSAVIDEQKADIYAEAGIPEYWLIRPDARAADVYRKPVSGRYLERSTFKDMATLKCASLPGVKIVLSQLWPTG